MVTCQSIESQTGTLGPPPPQPEAVSSDLADIGLISLLFLLSLASGWVIHLADKWIVNQPNSSKALDGFLSGSARNAGRSLRRQSEHAPNAS